MMNKVLLIDFDDSFTYNLVGLLESLNIKVIVKHWTQVSHKLIDEYDNFILGPGPGHPNDYALLNPLMPLLVEKKVIGICLGHQILGIFLGLKLRRLESPLHGKSLPLSELGKEIVGNKIYAQFYNSWSLTSDIGSRVSGDAIYSYMDMIYYFQHFNWQGVQFHPESVGTTCPRPIMEWLIKNMYNVNYEKLPSHLWDL